MIGPCRSSIQNCFEILDKIKTRIIAVENKENIKCPYGSEEQNGLVKCRLSGAYYI